MGYNLKTGDLQAALDGSRRSTLGQLCAINGSSIDQYLFLRFPEPGCDLGALFD